MAQKITKREKDYSQWYLDVVKEAKLAEHSPVRGCMVIRPTGMSLWENMQRGLDDMFIDRSPNFRDYYLGYVQRLDSILS